jgi:hypothetical protein
VKRAARSVSAPAVTQGLFASADDVDVLARNVNGAMVQPHINVNGAMVQPHIFPALARTRLRHPTA